MRLTEELTIRETEKSNRLRASACSLSSYQNVKATNMIPPIQINWFLSEIIKYDRAERPMIVSENQRILSVKKKKVETLIANEAKNVNEIQVQVEAW